MRVENTRKVLWRVWAIPAENGSINALPTDAGTNLRVTWVNTLHGNSYGPSFDTFPAKTRCSSAWDVASPLLISWANLLRHQTTVHWCFFATATGIVLIFCPQVKSHAQSSERYVGDAAPILPARNFLSALARLRY
ncbi:hypothetical protein NM688_g5932 [Phlebia brevispora]|uniref:Uncharacterized protein n=1 Tax=Phlebia brevispora TaxID=194682 RepID=A0ACC1SME6_9APHY|nr:hypothetical protein NM688_g5932 [Phlebia brevispora]